MPASSWLAYESLIEGLDVGNLLGDKRLREEQVFLFLKAQFEHRYLASVPCSAESWLQVSALHVAEMLLSDAPRRATGQT
jgi:hypothetical protein